jgi:hypothetical protein
LAASEYGEHPLSCCHSRMNRDVENSAAVCRGSVPCRFVTE